MKNCICIAGFLTLLVIAAGAQTRQDILYDDLGRVSTVVFTQGAKRLVVNYEYDKRDNIIRRTVQTTTDVNDENSTIASIRMVPNPATDALSVELSGALSAGAQLTITDVTGKVVLSRTVPPSATGTARVMLSKSDCVFADGVYVVTARKGEVVVSSKLIVSK